MKQAPKPKVEPPPNKGDVIERDGKRYRVTSVTPRLTRYKGGRDQFVTVEGHTLGLATVDSPIPAVQYAESLDDIAEALPNIYSLLLIGDQHPTLGGDPERIELALEDLRKLVPKP